MEDFSYRAIGTDGKEKKGSMQADSKEEVAKRLRDEGLTPTSITTASMLNKDINFSFGKGGKGVKPRDLAVFCRQFGSILRAGVNVIGALEMLSEQTESKALKAALKNVQTSVEKGETLAGAMRAEKGVFPQLLINMVAAGEASGSLEASIDRMAEQFEKDAKLKAMIKKAMMYPIVLCFVAIGVVIVMLTVVIPNFTSMFEDLGSDLPAFTKAVVAASDFIIAYWYILLIVVVGIVVAFKMWSKSESGAYTLAKIGVKAPIFGSLTQKTACARFSRTLSTLMAAGMPMIEAIDICARTMDNLLYRDALLKVKNGVGLGLELSTQLKSTGLFPAMVVHMTGIGEQTGSLEEMLNNIAVYYDEEVETATQGLTSMMEPLIILVMAGIVCLLIMAIYTPMISLYDQLG
ncbi:MAG: type II secretion system F family protein [Lachnospiraceae bacterium]